jgi:hypothetical protein
LRYSSLQARLGETETLSTAALMIQGGSDFCDKPVSSEGLDRYFTGPYQRTVLNGVAIFGGGPRSPLAGLVSQDASGASAYPVSCDRMPLRRR